MSAMSSSALSEMLDGALNNVLSARGTRILLMLAVSLHVKMLLRIPLVRLGGLGYRRAYSCRILTTVPDDSRSMIRCYFQYIPSP